jgi:hypothetical protein
MLVYTQHSTPCIPMQVERVNSFTSQLVGGLRASLKSLSGKVDKDNSKEVVQQLLAVSGRRGLGVT